MELLHIWGPIAIHSYGLFIACATLLYWRLIIHDERRKQLFDENVFSSLIITGIVSAFIGGRVVYALTSHGQIESFLDLLLPWYGGFSILGSVIATVSTIAFYLWSRAIPVLPTADILALYMPLLQAVARIGCLTAGCCGGTALMQARDLWLYSVHTHPTQLYSAGALLLLFACLYAMAHKRWHAQGTIFAAYVIGVGLERFIVDFFRADRTCTPMSWLSVQQCIALLVISSGLGIYWYVRRYTHERIQSH
ncbi:MAG: prolipoprotein diacylglyceryl transferase family protein [Candidatus Babeliales bacterium]